MKLRNLLNTVKSLPKKVLVTAALAAAVIPVAGIATADTQVLMEGHTEALNVTAGETQYHDSTDAKVDEVVQVQLWQHNREMPETTFANNNRVKFAVPTAQGKTQVITGTSSADNANTITDTTTLNLSMDRAHLEYIPDSAVFRYNKGAVDGRAECITGLNFPPADCYAEKTISGTDIINGGVNLDQLRGTPLKGCNAYHETVTIQVRVRADVVSINKYVRHKGQDSNAWTTSTSAKPGEDLEYMIRFKNEGNTQLNNVVVGDNMPKYVGYVSDSTQLKNGANPNPVAITSNNIVSGGIDVGNYLPGAVGYVMFAAKTDPLSAYPQCGTTYDTRNVGIVRPAGMNDFYNTAQVVITVDCANQPAFSCDLLKVNQGTNRSANYTVSATARNGATIKSYTFDFGDGTTPFTTTGTTTSHTYTKDGNYTANVKVLVDVNGQTQTVGGAAPCAAPVNFSSKPPVTPPSTPGKLPETGAGSTAAIFVAVTTASTVAYSVFTRRFSR